MRIIKLDAIDSTNDFLKQLAASDHVENFTIVTAKSQTKGKGQRGASWHSESGKNLTASILISEISHETTNIFAINIVTCLAVADALAQLKIPDLKIKWPNDIMSGNKKIGGILIENILQSSGFIRSVIGIGINVNQKSFTDLPHASSLILISGHQQDIDKLLLSIVSRLQEYLQQINSGLPALQEKFAFLLFKKDVPAAFENESGKFMAIIRGVSGGGQLLLELQNREISEFGIRTLKMLL